jgi:pilus assembly protein CpaC
MDCSQVPKLLPGQETRTPDDFELYLEGILEAPRGPRDVCPNKHYVPAYKNGPTAGQFPCAGNGHGDGPGGCAACLNGTAVPAAPVLAAPTADHAALPAAAGAAPANTPAVTPVSANSSAAGEGPFADLPPLPASAEEGK